jgi:hypothetical protein
VQNRNRKQKAQRIAGPKGNQMSPQGTTKTGRDLNDLIERLNDVIETWNDAAADVREIQFEAADWLGELAEDYSSAFREKLEEIVGFLPDHLEDIEPLMEEELAELEEERAASMTPEERAQEIAQLRVDAADKLALAEALESASEAQR